MNTLSERLLYLMREEKLKQKDFAALIETSPQTVSNWIRRSSLSRESAQAICEKTGYSLDWLLQGNGPPKANKQIESSIPPESEWGRVEAWDKNTPLDEDEIEVPFLKDIEFACGCGSYGEDDYNGFKLRFAKSTLRRVGANFDSVVCFPARGNSMEPFIPDGATVAIDCSNKKIVDGKVYAINHGGWKRLKVLYQIGPNKIRLRSFNKEEHPDEDVDMDDLEILGRMFWTSAIWY